MSAPNLLAQPPVSKNIIFVTDMGVDDYMAVTTVLAQSLVDPTIKVAGLVATAGNVKMSQAIENAGRILELTQRRDIKIYSGSRTPVGLEDEVAKVEADMYPGYGKDGFEDLGGWPHVTVPLQIQPGHEFLAEAMINATADEPLTIVCIAAWMDLYKAFEHAKTLYAAAGKSSAAYLDHVRFHFMGGVITPSVGANMPVGPEWKPWINHVCVATDLQRCKYSEGNVYWGNMPGLPGTTQSVFETLKENGNMPVFITLDLTLNPLAIWTPELVQGLRDIPNAVAQKSADMTAVMPLFDKPNFNGYPPGCYPMHDLHAAAYTLWGTEYFREVPVALRVAEGGAFVVENGAPATAKATLIIPERANDLLRRVVSLYSNFPSTTAR